MEHLRELRQRLFIYIVVFFVLTVGAFFARPIYLTLPNRLSRVRAQRSPTVFIVTSPFKFFADFSWRCSSALPSRCRCCCSRSAASSRRAA